MFAVRMKGIFLFLIFALFSQEESPKLELPQDELAENQVVFGSFFGKEGKKEEDGYTINYNTVSIIEYIRFASKICKINFIYDEADLGFTITVVSDEPVTSANVMATLVQVLRIHGLLLLEQEGNLVIHKEPGVRQIATLVTGDGKGESAPIVTRIFRIKNARPESIAAIVQPMISTSAMLEVSSETKQLIVTDVTANVDKIAALIENLDSPHTTLEIQKYVALHNSPDYLVGVGSQIMNPIAQGYPFILVPQDLSHEIFIVSTPELTAKALEVFASLDSVPKGRAKRQKAEDVFVYKISYLSGPDILRGLATIADNLKESNPDDTDLIDTIESAKWIRENNSVMFVGSTSSIAKTKEFLAALDSPTSGMMSSEKVSFFIYKPHNKSAEEMLSALHEMAHNLHGAQGLDEQIVETIQKGKVNPLTNTLSFTGPEETFPRIKELLATIDGSHSQTQPSTQFLIYKPQHQSGESLSSSLEEVASQLKSDKLSDPGLLHALASMKWVKSTQSLLFTGDPDSLKKLQALINTIDVASAEKPGYYIYKVQHTTGDVIEEDLDNLAKNLKASGMKDSPVLSVIQKIRYVKQTNSLVLTGEPNGIAEAKEMIAQYDYPRAAAPHPDKSSQFLLYKPINVPARQIEKSLKEIETNLKSAGLADPNILQSINSVKYVESINTLVFTGTPETLARIKEMVKEIDVPAAAHAPIQHVGKSTFLLYKLKAAGGPQIIGSIKNVTAELKRSGTADKEFLSALSTVKYIKETNSLFFTGTEEALTKVQNLVEQFDVSSLKAPGKPVAAPLSGPGTYFVYKPQSLSGPDLENLLQDFEENLKSSGLVDEDLFRTVESIRWSEQTQTLVFTGTQKAIDQVKELLKEFDIPSNAGKDKLTGPLEPSIQAIDNTSFLVYKLQFHKGDEIQNALRQIAKDLITNNAPVNSGLLNSINSIQWLEVTNSLLCSGDQDTLTRLRELIKNLDIPLKQVFIEMLVIETTLTNALTFGLEWGANYKYRNKFGAASYNTQPVTTSTPLSSFLSSFENLTPPTAPTPIGNIQPSSGFDLGVIGEVIRHNGQTFLTLGSLLTSLQTDDESSVIMTPKILTQDGRTSTIFDGRNIPFVGSFVQNNSTTTVNTSNIEYRDIGFSLTITPVLGNSDIVTLDINLNRTQTVGDVTGALDFNSASAQGITTTKTTMQTTVHVPDNNFLVLSGMVNNSNTKNKAGIPCLGGLPLVGAAFSKNNDTISNSNIVIFIRPHIINSIDEIRSVTKNEEDYFRDQTGTPFLEKGFDEALELLKTVDDD